MGQWCNQANQGIGALPTVNPGGFANLQAYVWVKPPGESDGNYPGSVYNGVTSTVGDPNCNPTNTNALANGMVINSISELTLRGHILANRVPGRRAERLSSASNHNVSRFHPLCYRNHRHAGDDVESGDHIWRIQRLRQRCHFGHNQTLPAGVTGRVTVLPQSPAPEGGSTATDCRQYSHCSRSHQ